MRLVEAVLAPGEDLEAVATTLHSYQQRHEPLSEALSDELAAAKQRAVAAESEFRAKVCWCLQEIAKAQNHYLSGFYGAKRDEFYGFWQQLEQAELALHFLRRHFPTARPEYGLRHLQDPAAESSDRVPVYGWRTGIGNLSDRERLTMDPKPISRVALALSCLMGPPSLATAQTAARPSDVATPETIVSAMYEIVTRRPGEPFDWDRFRTLCLPDARLIPNTEQTGGVSQVFSVEDFTRWADGFMPIGGPDDKGLQEEEIARRIERYGDIAQVFSTYQTRFWNDPEILARGINSIQLVHRDGRWWVVSVIWDEENGAGPLPERYRP